MPTHDPSDEDPPPAVPVDPPDDSSGYGPPPGHVEPRARRAQATSDDLSEAGYRPPPTPRRSSTLRVVVVLVLLGLLAAALLGYRAYHRSKVLAEGTAIAAAALRLDTAAGYRKAADTLEPLARLDPREAASMRAFALAMLACDYRETELGGEAETLIAAPGRAEKVPAHADLAAAALFLGRGAVGDAATYAGRASESPWSGALLARLSLLAGNPAAGFEPLQRALAADPGLPAALAMRGDLARRVHRDVHAARTSYAAALAASRVHPRAIYGLAKLALASQIPLNEAIPPLRALANDTQATPRVERARAALHLAALELRAGDRAAAKATLDAVEGLDRAARAWADLAVLIAASDRRGYRAVKGPPLLFLSASDDDPLEAPAIDPTPPPKAAAQPAAKPARKPAAKPVKKAPPPVKKAPAKKPSARKTP
jgi:hypothetical protein